MTWKYSTIVTLLGMACAPGLAAQVTSDTAAQTDNLPQGKGQLSLSTATVRLNSGTLEVVFIPLDERILRLIAPDSYASMEQLLRSQKRAIDSVSQEEGLSAPGIAFVSFHGTAPNTRFDPQLLTIAFGGQQVRPVGWIPLSANFSNFSVDVRNQLQALFIYRRTLPIKESFSIDYLASISDDWGQRLPRFDAERIRILGTRAPRDTTGHQP